MRRRSDPVAAVVAGSLALGLSACTLSACTQSTATTAPPTASFDVRVMQFNIEYGGTVVDFDSVPKAIRAADADVVALQEAYGNTCKVADALQWSYCDPRTQVISKFPLITPSDPSGAEVLVLPEQGHAFAMVNLHLPSAPYGPNQAAKGLEADELIANEQGRLKALEPVLDAANRVHEQGVPVVILGDFNSPSHRDWTSETAGSRDHIIAVEWPVTTKVEDAGYVDAYRSVYPDPVSDPGLTWPAARPKSGSYNPGLTGRPSDRIDMTFVSPDITVDDAMIVGESSSDMANIPVDPWPSDHRAVVTQFDIPLADPGPDVSASTRVIDQGLNVELFANAAEPFTVEIGDSTGERTPIDLDRGVAVLNTADLTLGESTLSLLSSDGEPVASGSLWVREPGAEPMLATSQHTYAQGEPIDVSWADAPGNKWDWVGVYKRGADPNVAWYKDWMYTGATIAGTGTIDADASGGPWPLPPGEYDVVLLADDSYAELARAAFTVRPVS
jgi:endonuclease/exonuclease/phosphatase family metal-dependent hydrolase